MTTRNLIFQAIYQILENLPPEKQQEVLNFAEFLQYQSSQPQFIQSQKTTDWLPGFFEEVIGGWVGEPLEQTEQGEYESREILFSPPDAVLHVF